MKKAIPQSILYNPKKNASFQAIQRVQTVFFQYSVTHYLDSVFQRIPLFFRRYSVSGTITNRRVDVMLDIFYTVHTTYAIQYILQTTVHTIQYTLYSFPAFNSFLSFNSQFGIWVWAVGGTSSRTRRSRTRAAPWATPHLGTFAKGRYYKPKLRRTRLQSQRGGPRCAHLGTW